MKTAVSMLHALLAALATAAMLVLALPDAGLWPLSFVALSPLLWVLPGLTARRAFLIGWLSGVAAQAGIFHWIAHTAVSMSDFQWWAALLVLLAYAGWTGLGMGVVALGARALLGRPLAVLAVPAMVTAVDFLFPYLFPWTIGNAFYRTPLLMQGMDITGVYGGTFVAVAVTVALMEAARALWARMRPRSALLIAPCYGPGWTGQIVAASLLCAWIGYGLVMSSADVVEPGAPVARLALVQPDITAEDKKHRDAASRKGLFARLDGMMDAADLNGADAVIWPEGAFSFYFEPETGGRKGWENIEETSRRLVSLVRRMGRPLVFGSLTEPAGRARNSVLMLGPDGSEIARYDKRRLLAFGEYMPLSDTLPFLKNRVKEVSDMEPGDSARAFAIGPARATISICYEAIFPGFTRDSLNDTGGNMILNFTNDAWFGESGAPAQHLMDQVPRAVELRVPLVRVTETGITAVVLPTGEFVHETGLHERRVDMVEVPVGETWSVYREVGDLFAWACAVEAAAALAMAWVGRRRERGGKSGKSRG